MTLVTTQVSLATGGGIATCGHDRYGIMEITNARFPVKDRISLVMETAEVRQQACLRAGGTPIVELALGVNHARRALRLKLESYNPSGSVKDRIAAALIDSVADQISAGTGIIESTSGNLGVAMAAVCNERKIPFTAVVDPHASPLLIEQITQLGASVKIIDEPDSLGGYLLSRIRYVRAQLAARPGLAWTNQYESDANPRAHFENTAPELYRQVDGRATVLVPVSTGGTLEGFRRFARHKKAEWRLIGVDITGSAALGTPPGQRLISGIGASQQSKFLNPAEVEAVHIDAAQAISACLWLADRAGVNVGGSSGAVVAAALHIFRADPGVDELTCICPDGADRYLTTIYQASWRAARKITVDDIDDDVELLHVRQTPGT